MKWLLGQMPCINFSRKEPANLTKASDRKTNLFKCLQRTNKKIEEIDLVLLLGALSMHENKEGWGKAHHKTNSNVDLLKVAQVYLVFHFRTRRAVHFRRFRCCMSSDPN
jgi:hypothetical protein